MTPKKQFKELSAWVEADGDNRACFTLAMAKDGDKADIDYILYGSAKMLYKALKEVIERDADLHLILSAAVNDADDI